MELFHLSKFQKQVQLFIPLEVSLLVTFGKEQGVVMGWVMLGASDDGFLLALSADNTSMLTLLRFIELCTYDLLPFCTSYFHSLTKELLNKSFRKEERVEFSRLLLCFLF